MSYLLKKIESCLTPRLKMVASLIPECNTVCDIGTDHGYVAIYAALHTPDLKVIAADLREGPLLAAEKNIKAFNMENRISLRLSDGFSEIAPHEADVAIVAGMGGETIAEILKNDKKIKSFVLQPQSAHYELRKFLLENNFAIKKEDICREGNKMYTAMLAEKTGTQNPPFSKAELEIGPLLIKDRHPMLSEYIDYRMYELDSILEKLKNAPSASEKMDEISLLKEMYLSIMEEI